MERCTFIHFCDSFTSSPIWIPTCIPKEYKYLSLFFRLLGALILLVPGFLYFSGYFVTSKASFIVRLPFIFIVSLCLLCIWILVKQDLVKLLKQA